MRGMEEFEDKRIKDFFAKDKVIAQETNKMFDDTIKQIRIDEENKNYRKKDYSIKNWLSIAACLLIIFIGANTYARASGYNNIFFMIKEVFEDKQPTKEDFFSDKDIIISYQSFYITDFIEMQVNELQIKDNNAKLYLYVNEKKTSDITPFRYKVYNENGEIVYEGISKKKEKTEYREILELKNYAQNQNLITLQIFSSDNKLLKTVKVNLEEKIIEARTESIEVEKISQIKLNQFLSKETALKVEEDKQILILKLTDIAYNNSMYIVKYLYSQITDEDIKNSKVENLKIYEGMAKFTLVDEEFKLSDIEINTENQGNFEKNEPN